MATTAAILICVILLGAGVFQALLAAGKPWGEWAFGGQMKGTLPTPYRIASLVSISIYAAQIAHYLGRAGVLTSAFSASTNQTINWVLVGFFALGTLMNGISRSKKERALWTPILAVSLLLSLAVALG